MGKRYFVFLGNIFAARDWDRFGCGYFSERGYEVIPVEFVDLLRPGMRQKMEHDGFKSVPQARAVASVEDMEALAAEFGPEDLIINNLHLDKVTAPLYWALKRHDVGYAVLNINNLPTAWYRGGPKGGIGEYLRLKLSDLGGVLYRLRGTLRNIVSADIGWSRLPSPRWWVRSGFFHSRFGDASPKLWKATVIKTHSFDVERARALGEAGPPDKPYAVFVDDGFLDPNHPDFVFAGRPMPTTIERYGQVVGKLLYRVEHELGVQVKIAMHPKSTTEQVERLFGDQYQVSHGNSAELIRGATFAMMHCSTAVSFAALFETPVLFMTTDEIEADDYYRDFITRLASWFGQAPVNIDHLSDTLGVPDLNAKCIADYRAAFLQEPDAAPGPVWQTVAECFENSLGAHRAA